MKIFVPGRICLFGEHSDWAGGYRRTNPELEKGYTIITGTNQGIYAEVRPHPKKFILNSTDADGTSMGSFELPMEREALLAEAEVGGFSVMPLVLPIKSLPTTLMYRVYRSTTISAISR